MHGSGIEWDFAGCEAVLEILTCAQIKCLASGESEMDMWVEGVLEEAVYRVNI